MGFHSVHEACRRSHTPLASTLMAPSRRCGVATHKQKDRPLLSLACSLLIMSTTAVTLEGTAYLKLMLHAAKYPWAAVNGFLLGEGGSTAGQVRNP